MEDRVSLTQYPLYIMEDMGITNINLRKTWVSLTLILAVPLYIMEDIGITNINLSSSPLYIMEDMGITNINLRSTPSI